MSTFDEICEAVGIDPRGYMFNLLDWKYPMPPGIGLAGPQPDADTPKREAIMRAIENMDSNLREFHKTMEEAINRRCEAKIAAYEKSAAEFLIRALEAEAKLRQATGSGEG